MEKDKAQAVRKMQDYIGAHLEDEITPAVIASAFGYSERHCKRLFAGQTGKPIAEYIRLMRLTRAADELRQSGESVLDIALSHQYHSHEGFTKAFKSAFGVAPGEYRREKPPIPLFVAYPADHQYLIRNEGTTMENNQTSAAVCTATIVPREKRKLVFLPSVNAADYMSFCEEMGCEWEGLLNSYEAKFDTAALLTLPKRLIPEGFGSCAAGVELPYSYSGKIPQGYYTAELEAGYMLYIESAPYQKEEDFCIAIEQAVRAYEQYQPQRYGFTYDADAAPSFNFGAYPQTGGRLAFPVKKL